MSVRSRSIPAKAEAGLILSALTGLVAAVALRDPHGEGSFGICPSLALTGWYCPGCGSLRALNDLAAARPLEAMGHNVLLLPALLVAVGWSLSQWLPSTSQRVAARYSLGPAWFWLVAVGLFTVVRNLPGSPLAP